MVGVSVMKELTAPFKQIEYIVKTVSIHSYKAFIKNSFEFLLEL